VAPLSSIVTTPPCSLVSRATTWSCFS